ncbi:hypothetical protein GIY62_35305 (plasmid) [Burkholderia plantarii]|uniref:hypothetical protein n=1 Tax=Burkholderia plantarii TaxID=41899 RepID=UPI00272B94A8|nr:hypothetical protein [Burkholderia plantarii]WLE64132.1 hypothetical protein GIY62_35305 [Burkholderia plantarii]
MTESARVDITQHDVVSIVSQDLGLSHTQSMLDAIQLEAGRLDCDFFHEGDATFVPFELKTALAWSIPEADGAMERDTTLDAILESLSAQGIHLQTGAKTDELLRADARRQAQVAAQRQEDGVVFPPVDASDDGSVSSSGVAVLRDAAQIVVDVTKDQLILTGNDFVTTYVWRAEAYGTFVRRISVERVTSDATEQPADHYRIVAGEPDYPSHGQKVMVENLTWEGALDLLARIQDGMRARLGVEQMPAEAAAPQPTASEHGAVAASSYITHETKASRSFLSRLNQGLFDVVWTLKYVLFGLGMFFLMSTHSHISNWIRWLLS